MKLFLIHILAFLLLLGGLLGGACFFLPDETARKTMLGAQVDKLNRLGELPGKRIIIVGGSGCGQGFVTSNLCEALNRPVYNMGLHAGLGLIYQMKSVEPFVREGDVVILIPEYANFDGSLCFGDAELLMMVCDTIPEHKMYLSALHWSHLLHLVPKYGADKLRHCFMRKSSPVGIMSFDQFGDRIIPSGVASSAQVAFPPYGCMDERNFSPVVISYIKAFAASVAGRGGLVYLFPPAFQKSSFGRQSRFIECISRHLKENGLGYFVDPERYALDDEFFYDTPYHLNLDGREFRSRLFCADIWGLLKNR